MNNVKLTLRGDGMYRAKKQHGAIAVMAAAVLVIMLAMFAMALDLSRTYNRKIELQSVADAVALAAAGALDGTPEGVDKALAAANTTAAAGFNYSYGNRPFQAHWSSSALTFATAADGGVNGWMPSGSAKGIAGSVFFARVDTSVLEGDPGVVTNVFAPIMSSSSGETNVGAAAVAGRDSVNILPLAICAISNTAATSRSGELVEYGFRRGVAYDLMNLNPNGTSPENFLVSPIAPAGTVGTSVMNKLDVVGPFVCTGKMAIPTVLGGAITVERPFPIASLYPLLNSRFGTYVSPCTSSSAPADANMTSFNYKTAAWMSNVPDGQSANAAGVGQLVTVADLNPTPAGTKNTAYGPLWSYAKAAKYASYVSNSGVEPAAGYATYATTDWSSLYSPGTPVAKSYPSTTPYQNTGGSVSYKTLHNTRVLNIPLLACPVPAGFKATATVKAIGKFFMTVPANVSSIHAEFAGLATESAVGGNARLYK